MKKPEIEPREMYLKAVYSIQRRERRNARPVDVARYLEVSKASVSEMLRKLRKQKLIAYKKGAAIRLTKAGLVEARKITHNCKILEEFFRKVLKIPEERAAKEACELEHYFTEDTISRIKRLAETHRR